MDSKCIDIWTCGWVCVKMCEFLPKKIGPKRDIFCDF